MVSKTLAGQVNGVDFYEFTLQNGDLTVTLLEYGASVHTLLYKGVDMVAGYDTPQEYVTGTSHQGATVGRFANRIANGAFSLNGKTYTLEQNNGTNCLHGGSTGFGRRLYKGCAAGENAVAFTIQSPAGEGGFPGALTLTVTFTVEDNTLKIHYQASADADTPMNFTNHTSFTMGSRDLSRVTLQVMSPAYTQINENLIPTGKLVDVTFTPFDFRMPKSLLRDVEKEDEQLQLAGGYDHHMVIAAEPVMRYNVATVHNTETGVYMAVSSDMPGMQVYGGNMLKNEKGKGGLPLSPRSAFCLETQQFPDAPNHPEFPSCIVKAGETYQSDTWYRFYEE